MYYLNSAEKLSSAKFTLSFSGDWTTKKLKAYLFYHHQIPVECMKVLKVENFNVEILRDDHRLRPEHAELYAVYVSSAADKLGATTQKEFEEWWKIATTRSTPQVGTNGKGKLVLLQKLNSYQ